MSYFIANSRRFRKLSHASVLPGIVGLIALTLALDSAVNKRLPRQLNMPDGQRTDNSTAISQARKSERTAIIVALVICVGGNAILSLFRPWSISILGPVHSLLLARVLVNVVWVKAYMWLTGDTGVDPILTIGLSGVSMAAFTYLDEASKAVVQRRVCG